MPSINTNTEGPSAAEDSPEESNTGVASGNRGGGSPQEGMDPRMMGGYPPYYYPPMGGDPSKGGFPPPGQYPSPPGGGHFPPYGFPPGAGNPPYGAYPPPYGGRMPPGAQPNWYGFPPGGDHNGGSFPGPPSMKGRSTRGGRSAPTKLPYSPPRLREKGSTEKSSEEKTRESTKKMDDLEAERVRIMETEEESLAVIKPIQTDFHFFVAANKDKYRALAEEEIKKGGAEPDLYLVNTNLNSRLLRAWLDLSEEDREVYSDKEQEDRKRFMQEDEVASRHCITLTARYRSGNKGKEDEKRESSGEPLDESPSKKNRIAEANDA